MEWTGARRRPRPSPHSALSLIPPAIIRLLIRYIVPAREPASGPSESAGALCSDSEQIPPQRCYEVFAGYRSGNIASIQGGSRTAQGSTERLFGGKTRGERVCFFSEVAFDQFFCAGLFTLWSLSCLLTTSSRSKWLNALYLLSCASIYISTLGTFCRVVAAITWVVLVS